MGRMRISASRLTKSNANTFVRARAYGLFQPRVSGSTSCVGNIPWGLRPFGWSLHTRLIPTHSVGISHTSLASLKYCYNTIKTECRLERNRNGRMSGCAGWFCAAVQHRFSCAQASRGMLDIYGTAAQLRRGPPRSECLYDSRIGDKHPTGGGRFAAIQFE